MLSSSFRAGSGFLGGDVVVLTSGLIFAIQTIAQKKTFPLIPPATLLFNQSVVAIPIFFAYSGLFEGFGTYRATPGSVGGVIFQGVAVSGICFTVWLLLLGKYPAGQLATVAFVTPMFGVAFGRAFQGEPLTLPLVLGGSLVGVGIYLTAGDRPARAEPSLPGEDAA